MSIAADEDDKSSLTSTDDQSTGVDKDATSDVGEEVLTSGMPGGNPTPSKVSFYDPGDPEDPDDRFQFPSATSPRISFTDIVSAKCNADGTRKFKRAVIYLPNAVQFDLCQRMCSNHYVHELAPGACRTTLEPFEQQYRLHDRRKHERARGYIRGEIDECARRFSNQVRK